MKFDELAGELNASMLRDYDCVHKQRNPVYACRSTKLSNDQLAYAVSQYTLFPKNIVSFLYATRDNARKAGWAKVDTELTRNMGQELGTETGGISHYNLLAEGLENIGLNTGKIEPSPVTQRFIENMRSVANDEVIPHACGGVYAMESSARPELQIVLGLVDELNRCSNDGWELDGKLKWFFDMHIRDWEPGHERGLRDALSQSIGVYGQDFRKGFHDVMGAMDSWWLGLYNESLVLRK